MPIKEDILDVRIAGICSKNPNIYIDGKLFCATGEFDNGTRQELYREIEKAGGLTSDTVTRKTDYLIVGNKCSQAWAYSCYGRKVEKAISMRKSGQVITIIRESDFMKELDKFQ
jgi:NAD-dependent DNA ligase